ncbi:hypothetical protein [Telluribacter humicola]|uniref:hypothetical protein n=1 Tax=Telluribacter humicola TaxID=1720261 RepID=UPI001A95C769|nr:hypothetical protein [Telluribacter humicola]
MKTSNKLLLALFAFILVSSLGANLPLKKTYDTINRNDPYYGYAHETLPAFKYVKLVGQSNVLAQIQLGTRFEMRRVHFKGGSNGKGVITEMRGDTLIVLFEKDARPESYSFEKDPLDRKPSIYIMAPTLSGVSSEGIFNKITGWQGGSLSVTQVGKNALLTDNRFDSLSVSAYSGSFVDIDANNRIGAATCQVRDSSRLAVEKDIFNTFQLQADTNAHVSLPGSMLRKVNL